MTRTVPPVTPDIARPLQRLRPAASDLGRAPTVTRPGWVAQLPRTRQESLKVPPPAATRSRDAANFMLPSGTLGHCYIVLFLAIYHLGYIAPAKLLYSKGAISILCYIATWYIAIL